MYDVEGPYLYENSQTSTHLKNKIFTILLAQWYKNYAIHPSTRSLPSVYLRVREQSSVKLRAY